MLLLFTLVSIPETAHSSPKSYEIKLTKNTKILKIIPKQKLHLTLNFKRNVLKGVHNVPHIIPTKYLYLFPAVSEKKKPNPKRRRLAKNLVVNHRVTHRVRRRVSHRGGGWAVVIKRAARKYGVSASSLIRVMHCESNGNQKAYNPSGASGLFQFMPSTWKGTPYGRYSIWNGKKQAYAAAWMFSRGRKGEWTCY